MPKIFLITFFIFVVATVNIGRAQSNLRLKMPFDKNSGSWTIGEGYGGEGSDIKTHIHKDEYALDFTLPGEADFNLPALAAAGGMVVFAGWQDPNDKKKGYGFYVDVDHGGGFISRYAHLNSISVEIGQVVRRGQEVGKIDNTGFSFGSHLHFAVYQKQSDGTLAAYKPEPISGYTDLAAGNWYVSDNELYQAKAYAENPSGNGVRGFVAAIAAVVGDFFRKTTALIADAVGAIVIPSSWLDAQSTNVNVSTTTPGSEHPMAPATQEKSSSPAFPGNSVDEESVAGASRKQLMGQLDGLVATLNDKLIVLSRKNDSALAPSVLPAAAQTAVFSFGVGGVSFTPSSGGGSGVISASSGSDVSSSIDLATSTATSTTTDAATSTTTSIATSTTETTPDVPSSTTSGMPTSTILFAQNVEDNTSFGSWYSDNWYKLGNGFSGTIHKATLRGQIDDPNVIGGIAWLEEFKDPAYKNLVRTLTISSSAFGGAMATTTFDNLNFTLKPYFYYRLDTLEGYQNRSVILAGTVSSGTSCGEPCRIAMWNEFQYGIGKVEHTYTFLPYLILEGEVATSTLAPPQITSPGNFTPNFNLLTLELALSWSSSTDPDWPENPLHYEINYSTSTNSAQTTSTELDAANWRSVGIGLQSTLPLVPGNYYLVGVRAADNFGGVSTPSVMNWSFPERFIPYLLSDTHSSASQNFMLQNTGTLRSIEIFLSDFETSSRNPDGVICSLSLYDASDTPASLLATGDNSYNGNDCIGHLTFTFGSTPELLSGHAYRWIFSASTNSPTTYASVKFYGITVNTAGGVFSDSTLANAKFILNGDSGILFGN